MRIRTYGGVRGRKTKVGEKLLRFPPTRLKSLEELLVQKGIAIDKANRQNKALGKLVSGKKSERQEKNPQDSMTQEEFDKKKKEQAEKRIPTKFSPAIPSPFSFIAS